MNKIHSLSFILTSLLLICVIVKYYFPCNYYSLFVDNKKICGVGKTDFKDKKYGKWIYFYPKSGNIRSIGDYSNNLKENIWIGFFDNNNRNNHLYETLYKQGKVNGVFYVYNDNSELIHSYYCKNGVCYFKENNYHKSGHDFEPYYLNNINFIESLYNQEYGDKYDSEWNHKIYSNKLNILYRKSFLYKLDEYQDFEPHNIYDDIDLNIDDLSKEVTKFKINEYNDIINSFEVLLIILLFVINIIKYQNAKK